MGKLKSYCKSYMVRPVIYRAFSKFMVGLVLILLWDRYINTDGLYTVSGFGFPILGVVLCLMAWLNYIKLDGIKVHGVDEVKKMMHKKLHDKPVRHAFHDMVDFVEEPIMPFDELEEDEQVFVSLASNLVSGGVFLVLSTAMSFL